MNRFACSDPAVYEAPGRLLNPAHAEADLHSQQCMMFVALRHRWLQRNVQLQTAWIAKQPCRHQMLQ